jgi:hypothetical protein
MFFLTFALAREPASSPGWAFCSSHSGNSFASARFFATKAGGNGLLKQMQPSAIDEAITLRRWNMTIPTLRVELATAKKRRPF